VSSPPTSYEIEARVVRSGVSAATSKQAVIEFDTSAGQSEILPGPADLLTTAFAACVLKNVERFSQILPFRYQEASIKVVAERQEDPPKMIRVTYSLHLVTDEPEHRVELLHRNIRKYGTIYNTLAATCDVSGKVLLQRPDTIVAR
jgi:Predicted redox protein, regulator of disulfide bond formation